jgi:hypothetical protein
MEAEMILETKLKMLQKKFANICWK